MKGDRLIEAHFCLVFADQVFYEPDLYCRRMTWSRKLWTGRTLIQQRKLRRHISGKWLLSS